MNHWQTFNSYIISLIRPLLTFTKSHFHLTSALWLLWNNLVHLVHLWLIISHTLMRYICWMFSSIRKMKYLLTSQVKHDNYICILCKSLLCDHAMPTALWLNIIINNFTCKLHKVDFHALSLALSILVYVSDKMFTWSAY